jgi:hypothetical protein
MNYKAYITFVGNTSSMENQDVPVAQLSVAGGTNRVIDFSSADDVSIVSELEQARSNKSLAFHISSNDGAKAMKATVDLMNVAMEVNTTVALVLSIEKLLGKRKLEGFTAVSDIATIPFLPRMAAGNTLEVSFVLENLRVYQGLFRRGAKIREL